MNPENPSSTPQLPTPDQWEERIVAWVAGEASAFEISVLESVVAARPELAVFKRRIEAIHGLVGEAARPDPTPLRLAPDRRAKLLKTLGVTDPAPTRPAKVAIFPAARKKSPWSWYRSLGVVAACLCVGLLIVSMTIPAFQKVRRGIEPSSEWAAKQKVERMAGEADAPTVLSPSERSSGAADAAYKKSDAFRAEEETQALVTQLRQETAKEQLARRVAGEIASNQLEPFEVSVPADPVGYTASSTLAGTRIRTELKDVGSAISVVSDQLLKDTGATDSQKLLTYTTGTEVGGVKGNFVGDKSKAQDRRKRLAAKAAPRVVAPEPVPAPAAKGWSGNYNGSQNGVSFGYASPKGIVAPAAPAAVDEKNEEAIILSPFCISERSDFLKTTSRTASVKKSPRPSPDQTSIGPDAPIRGLAEERQKSADPAAPADDKPVVRPAPPPPASAEETSAAQEPVSTFSLHVSDVSFRLALAALTAGQLPDRSVIRPEEFYNAFDYGDPAPAVTEKISCRIEQAAHPFAQQRNLVRIALRVPATGRGAGQPLRLTVLLDTSGSMERPDRRATVRAALATLVGLLGPADRLTLIGFARQPRLLAEQLAGDQARQALDLLDRTPAEGGTNLEAALQLGGQLARRQFSAAAQNRLVILTDGAANLGDADPARLAAAVETLRAQRIAFDACGVGLDGLDDTMLEALTRKGDGRYYVLAAPEAADASFAAQLAGALRPAAENVKVQVRFNPARVGAYRLVGFEKHRLREEDFRNDAVDAAELAAEEAAVALYEVEARPQGEGELGEVFVRFRDAASREMVERSWTMAYESRAPAFDRASPSLQLAGTAAALAEKIRGGPAGDRVELDALAPVINALRGRRPADQRLQELAAMFAQLRRLQAK